MSEAELTAVAYKKGNWMRYTLWGLAVVCVTMLLSTFFSAMSGEISAAVPEGYRFSVTDNYGQGSDLRTTYYVYDDHIIVEDESFTNNSVNRSVMLYDDVNTSSLTYDPEDTTEICELGSCYARPKILAVVKKLVSRKIGREYIGL